MKRLVILIVVLILAIIGLTLFNSGSSSVVDDAVTYTDEWRNPSGGELLTISKLMVANKVRGCGEYMLKEVDDNEYVIACTKDGKNWIYYIAWPKIDKIGRVTKEMEVKLISPK